MDFKKLFQLSRPHLLALGGLLLLSGLFFYPLLDGKKLKQEDIRQFESITRFDPETGRSLPEKYAGIFNGEIDGTLWTDNMLGGMPVYLIHNDDRSNILNDLIPNKWTPIGRLFLFSALAYALFIFLTMPPLLAFGGAFVMAFSTNNLILLEAGHMTKLAVLSYIPLVLIGFIAVFRRKYVWGGVLFAAGLSLMLAMNHIQMTYYLFLALAVLFVTEGFRSAREKAWLHFVKATGSLSLGLLVGLLSNLHILWPVYELSKETVRGEMVIQSPDKVANMAARVPEMKMPNPAEQGGENSGLSYENAMLWSFGWKDILSSYIPGFVGGSEREFLPASSKLARINVIPDLRVSLYWGPLKSTNGPVYVGAILLFLMVLGLFLPRDDLQNSYIVAVVLTVLLSFGRYLGFVNQLLFDYLPFYNKFRAPNSIWGVTTVFIALLGIYSLHRFLFVEKKEAVRLKALKNAFYVCGGVALAFLLLGGSLFDFISSRDPEIIEAGYMQDELVDARKILQRLDTFRSLVLVGMASIFLWLAAKNKMKVQTVMLVLVVLLAADLWQVGKRYIARDKFVSRSFSQVEMPLQAQGEAMLKS